MENGFMLKLDGNGNYIWSKIVSPDNFLGSLFFSSVETSDGGCIGIGNIGDQNGTFIYAVKVNNGGELQWTKTFKSGDNSYGAINNIIKTSDGGYLAAGSLNINDGETDALLMKFDINFSSCKPAGTSGSLINFGSLGSGAAAAYTGNTITYNETIATTLAGVSADICASLPLTLLEFNGAAKNGFVELKWKTTGEINTSYFDVEKSNDAKSFLAFSKVVAGSNGNTYVKQYITSDNNPYKGNNWYRLKMVDKDGSYTYSNALRVIAGTSNDAALIFPNPVVHKAVLQFSSSASYKYVLKVTNVSGKLLQTIQGTSYPGKNEVQIDMSKYSKGTYFIMLTYDGGKKKVLKLSKG